MCCHSMIINKIFSMGPIRAFPCFRIYSVGSVIDPTFAMLLKHINILYIATYIFSSLHPNQCGLCSFLNQNALLFFGISPTHLCSNLKSSNLLSTEDKHTRFIY